MAVAEADVDSMPVTEVMESHATFLMEELNEEMKREKEEERREEGKGGREREFGEPLHETVLSLAIGHVRKLLR